MISDKVRLHAIFLIIVSTGYFRLVTFNKCKMVPAHVLPSTNPSCPKFELKRGNILPGTNWSHSIHRWPRQAILTQWFFRRIQQVHQRRSTVRAASAGFTVQCVQPAAEQCQEEPPETEAREKQGGSWPLWKYFIQPGLVGQLAGVQ